MLKNLKKLLSLILLTSFWLNFGAISIVRGQDVQSNQEKKQEKNEKKEKQAEKGKTARPLSEKEDPSKIGKRNINKGGDSFFGWLGGSQEKEIAIGRQLAAEIDQQVKLVDDPIITEYINRVGQNLVLHSDAKIPFTIKVIESDEVNAFALPGGFFYVNTGLILATDTEAELASVMAHEIAHVAARHAIENFGKSRLLGIGIIAGIIFGGGVTSTILQNVGGLGEGLAYLHFSRSAEEEADMLGVQYLYAAGYDPTAMATMFEKLAAQNRKKPSALKKLFSTHPPSLERRDKVLALVARFPEKQEYIISTSEYQRVKERLMRMTNVKALVASDGQQEDTRPTLKRRQPEPDDAEKNDSPPQLKRRSPEPSPSPTPSN
ncbi:MAG: M48 family metallopeptidase [Pyrinomonadaceae bacterium]|nr:M48 family metallopeptidase [Pyrinomonadaceae bacterium]MCX7640439.1 M48 family metallopeptidase [Pyrinomonadaceae bacterium]MDW8304866.1 M48 family metallopeptidase [Acidobacteriota bacterium]